MIVEFHDPLQKNAHYLFQEWRLKNPDGFFLSPQGKKKDFILHHVGCTHILPRSWPYPSNLDDMEDTIQCSHSLTKNRKICSSTADELLVWLSDKNFSNGLCSHCLDISESNFLKPSKSAIQKMGEWIVSNNEQIEIQLFKSENTTSTTDPDAVEGNWRFHEETGDIEIVGDQQEESIKGRTDIGSTTKEQLVKSRRGQGVFKANVRLNEKGCRVTGVTDPQHLRASHIKPWKDSSDEEKLNGCNGLLLAPHVDHLFDKGQISFSDNGDLLISQKLDRSVLAQWGISDVLNVGSFNALQSEFLHYHRSSVFIR